MTSFIHPDLNDASFHVSVKRIRFRTTFLKIGFGINFIQIKEHGMPLLKRQVKVQNNSLIISIE